MSYEYLVHLESNRLASTQKYLISCFHQVWGDEASKVSLSHLQHPCKWFGALFFFSIILLLFTIYSQSGNLSFISPIFLLKIE